MNRKVFYVIAFLVLAAVIAGGCGGSSNNSRGGMNTASESPSMMDVRDTEEFREMIQEISENGTYAKMQANRHYYFDDEEYEIEASRDVLVEGYEDGAVIIMYNADLKTINAMRSFLGDVGESSAALEDQDRVDLYAMAKRTAGNSSHTFTYMAPHIDDSSQEDGKYSFVDFQVDRWKNYFSWEADINDMAGENAAFASEYAVKAAAANDITAVAGSTTITRDESYKYPVKEVEMNGTRYRELGFNRSYASVVTYRVFSAHSFTNGKDYYLVKCNLKMRPTNVFHDTVVLNVDDLPVAFERVAGYIRQINFETNINAANTHADTSPKMSEASCVAYAPKSDISRESSHTETISWEEGGEFTAGANGSAGILEGGMRYANTLQWDTTEYSIINEAMKDTDHIEKARWRIDFDVPTYDGELKASPASVSLHEKNFEWVWEIDKSFWKAREALNIYIKMEPVLGETVIVSGGSGRQEDLMVNAHSYVGSVVPYPGHTTVHQRDYFFNKVPSERGGFQILSEGEWEASSDVDWIQFSEVSGKATGDVEYWFWFIPTENKTGKDRNGFITLKSRSSLATDTIKIRVAQSGTY